MRVTREFEAGHRARVLQECITSALPSVWERRAVAWEDARPRATDYNGRATRDELVDRDERCRQRAAACLSHARLLRETEPVPVPLEVIDVLMEVA